MQALLSIQNLSVSFEQDGRFVQAVNDISLDVSPGEMLAIVGESGSGKSVTALSVLGLLPKHCRLTGEIRFNGKQGGQSLLPAPDNKTLNSIRGNAIAMIFQEPMTSLNPLLTCGEQVAEVLIRHLKISKKIARDKTVDLFASVKLPDPSAIFDRYPHQLSGGQKQRVMIAMAMSCEPGLLIADEPTTALDVTVQRSILELIRDWQHEKQMGVILITHDLGIVSDIADSIAVMYKGSIVEYGKAAEVLHQPQHAYTRALMACRPAGKKKGERLPVVSDFMKGNGDRKEKIAEPVKQNRNIPSGNTVALEVNDLVVRYPAQKNFFGRPIRYFNAVDGVSLNVFKGESVGLVGESGCGKTTLGKAILQLVRPSSGKIRLNGNDLAGLPAGKLKGYRKDLQVVFQDPYGSLNPRISIGQSILEPLLIHGHDQTKHKRREKLIQLLESVGLSADQANRYPHQFSGGQRQRICIARALATDPRFLIFDESVSALDVSVQAQVLNLLNELRSSFGFTSVFISHDLSVVHYFCDRILVMQKGKIVEEGSANDIYHHPRHPYTRELISAIPGREWIQSP